MTLAEARTPTDTLVTMHLVVSPPKARAAHTQVARTGRAQRLTPARYPCQVGKAAKPKAAAAADGQAHPASSGCCAVQ